MTQPPPHHILDWWRSAVGDRTSGAARALAARLRRATPLEALSEPQVHHLAHRIQLHDGARLAMMACLLAEIRTHQAETLFARLGPTTPDSDDATLSRLRFQKLLRSEDEALHEGLRRAIRMADQTCNVERLGRDIQYLNAGTRQRWCFDYFGGAAPHSDPSQPKDT